MITFRRWLARFCLIVIFLFSLLLFLQASSKGSLATPIYPGKPGANTSDQVKGSSSVITLTGNGRWLLVVNSDSNSLSLVDTLTLSLIIEIPVGVHPKSVSLAPDDRLAYVTNQGSGSLSVVDLEAQVVVREVAIGNEPVGAAVSPNGRFLAIAAAADDTVHFLETADLSPLGVIAVGDRPYGLAFSPDGRSLLVTHLLSGNVTVLAVRPYWQFLPIFTTGQAESTGLQTDFPHEPPPIDQPALVTTIATWPHIAPAPAVGINAAGTRAYLPQTMANGLGLNTQFDTTVFPKVSVLNLENWQHQSAEHISLPETDRPVGLPWDVALVRDETELWVVNAASNDISVIDIHNPTNPSRGAHIPVGDNPRGIVLSPDGQTVYVNNTLAGTVSVIDTGSYTVTAVITSTHIPLPPILLTGKRLFHSSARPDLAQANWVSCNTCHIEGEQDGRTWLLPFAGELPPGAVPVIKRNTTSLLGMIETYPLRWSAAWDEAADSEFSIRFEQFGTGLISGEMHDPLGAPNQGRSADLDALAAFIDSLLIPNHNRNLNAAAQRGQTIFESAAAGCAICHPAPLYTDLQVHDVGTADGPAEWNGPLIDTPTLRFLYDSAPYLHDGQALSLLDVLTTANPADKHGQTAHLSTQELADLIAFLLVLPYE